MSDLIEIEYKVVSEKLVKNMDQCFEENKKVITSFLKTKIENM